MFTHGAAGSITNPAGSGTVTINFPPDPFLNYTADSFGPANAVGSALKLMMDKSGDSRSVTIDLLPGNEIVTPNHVNLIADLTSPGRLTIDGHHRVLELDDQGTLLTVGDGVTLTLRNITLRGINDNTDHLIEIQSRGRLILGEGVTLTDNKTSGDAGGICVRGGELVMNDGVVIKKMEAFVTALSSGTKGGGVLISNKGRFVMHGGIIGGENASDGNVYSGTSYYGGQGSGGVSVLDGSFDMYNGIIQSNTASTSYGGVGVFQGGTFTMYRGTIKNNTAKGSGVGISSGGAFTMNGAEAIIEDNTGQGNGSGGGVLNGGTFTMYAGTIQGNKTIGESSGGGVYNGGTFTMYAGGTIQGNTATQEYSGGGVYSGGNFIMDGGTIKGNSALGTSSSYQGESAGGVLAGGTFNMSGGIIGGVAPGDANTTAALGGASANGVCVRLGTFTMSGGIIMGNTANTTNNYGVSVVRNVSHGTFTIMGSAVITPENKVFLAFYTAPRRTIITIGGILDHSPAANIIFEDPDSPPSAGTMLLKADSSALITENYDKFLYNGVANHINSSPVNEDGFWYGVYQ
jgi:hypothetical protein